MNEGIVAKLKDYFEKRDDVVLAYLFGSQAKGTATEGRSDYDIAVYFKTADGHLDYEAEIGLFDAEDVISDDTSAITGTDVDLVVLNRAPASIVFSAINGTIVLTEKDHDLFMDLLLKSSADAEDYRELVRDFYEISMRSHSLSEHDRERLRRTLIFLNNEIEQLAELENIDQKIFEQDRGARRILERSVEIMVNASIDIAKILIASRKRNVPEKYADIMKHLGYLDNFDEKIANWLAQAATLRNFVAHEYLDMEYARIKRLVLGARENFTYLIGYSKKIIEEDRPNKT